MIQHILNLFTIDLQSDSYDFHEEVLEQLIKRIQLEKKYH
jgi:hypothetical protein